MADDVEALKEYIEQKGGSNAYVDRLRRGHPRIYFTYRGVTRFLVVSRSSSDHRALENAKSTINDLFTFITDITPRFVEEVKKEVKQPLLRAVPQTFGERLQYAREQQQLSRERLADVSGVDEDLIQRFEVTKQESLLDFTTALLLSSALNLSLAYLVGEQTASEFEPMTELGEAISRERQRRSMSLTDLSEKTGMSVQQLANIETGLFTPPSPKIDQIATALWVKRETLTKEEPAVVTPTQPTKSPDQILYDGVNTLDDFAHFFKFLRERKGLSQMKVADALGMAYPSEVSRVERGLWAGPVYKRHTPLAQVLGVPPLDMKIIIDRVIKNAGPSPSNILKKERIARLQVSQPEPEVVHNVTGWTPTQVASPIPDQTATVPVQMSPLETERLVHVMREQAEITRALMRDHHKELIAVIRELSTDPDPVEVMQTVIRNLFRKD